MAASLIVAPMLVDVVDYPVHPRGVLSDDVMEKEKGREAIRTIPRSLEESTRGFFHPPQ
jgi:hypothetical protein